MSSDTERILLEEVRFCRAALERLTRDGCARAREHDEMRERVKTLEDRLAMIAGKMVVVSALASTLLSVGASWIARQF
jgi:predicted AAA+ superfamily ATPase